MLDKTTPNFIRKFADAVTVADLPHYQLLRPVLLELKSAYLPSCDRFLTQDFAQHRDLSAIALAADLQNQVTLLEKFSLGFNPIHQGKNLGLCVADTADRQTSSASQSGCRRTTRVCSTNRITHRRTMSHPRACSLW